MSSQGQARKRSQIRRLSTRVAGVVGAVAFVAVGAAVMGVNVPFSTSSASAGVIATPPLNQVGVPKPTNYLGPYVADEAAAVRLGKALFWDMQAGSDGKTACATCHFSAGTDSRTRNTLNPGKDANGVSLTSPFAANTDLTPASFPLGDAVAGSQGVVPSSFTSIIAGSANETTTPASTDPVFATPGQNEVQQISGSPTAAFQLTFDGLTTSALTPLSTTATAAEIQAALEALANIGPGGATATGGPLGTNPVDITFDGPLVAGRNVPQLALAAPDAGVTISTQTSGGGNNLRRVTGRNTPTVINAVFNHRNFWDGRAQNHFNGVNPFGTRDNTTRIASAVTPGGVPALAAVPAGDLNDASLASQAVGPPGNNVEMSSDGRTLRDIGKKLLALEPLQKQVVAPTDSVLGPFVDPADGKGLRPTTYRQLVEAAFNPRLYQGNTRTISAAGTLTTVPPIQPDDASLPTGSYTQMQYNWPLFWGLAINLYEATLVSDQTPMDKFLAGDANALTASQKAGFTLFWNTNKQTPAGVNCAGCHGPGPELTAASVANVGAAPVTARLGRPCNDSGFFNLGVRPTVTDVGNGGTDPFGKSLSETVLAVQNNVIDGVTLCPPSPAVRQVDGSFKTPGLRNVGLTAPYFHNGGKSTLEQVVAFYNAGGEFLNPQKSPELAAPLGLTPAQQTQLVDFLRNGLTDPRVQQQSAPFDHPQLIVPNGHVPGGTADNDLVVAATGAAGTAAPFATFLGLPGPKPNPPIPPGPGPTPGPTKITFGVNAFKLLKLKNVKTKGIVVTVQVPPGTAKIRIHFLKITKKGQLLVASFDKVVKGTTGTVKIVVPIQRLRRMTTGKYVVTTTRIDGTNHSLETFRRRLSVVK